MSNIQDLLPNKCIQTINATEISEVRFDGNVDSLLASMGLAAEEAVYA